MGNRLGGWLVAAAAAVVILGVSVAPFLIPAVVRFEQDRAGVAELTGFRPIQLDRATDALLGDLVLWRGSFELQYSDLGYPMEFGGAQFVLNDAERAHMRDVRNVFTGFWLLIAAAVVVLAVASRRARDTESRAALWRAEGNGARALAIGIAAAGVVAILAFEAAFEVFHRLFFSSGSYTFDPARDRLVQLFPMQFWSDISIAVGAVALVLSLLTVWIAHRLTRNATADVPAPTLTTSQVPT